MSEAQGQDQFQAVANRRSGYGDRLHWALKIAKAGGTLAAGEGQLLVMHYEEQLQAHATLVEAVQAVHAAQVHVDDVYRRWHGVGQDGEATIAQLRTARGALEAARFRLQVVANEWFGGAGA